MKTLVVGTGALGGIIGAHLLAAGASVSLATRRASAAEEIKPPAFASPASEVICLPKPEKLLHWLNIPFRGHSI